MRKRMKIYKWSQSSVPSNGIRPLIKGDWDIVFVKFLKLFFDATLRPVLHFILHHRKLFKLRLKIYLIQMVLHHMTVNMRAKFQKYIGSLDDMNQQLMVALVLDPRYPGISQYVKRCLNLMITW